MLCETNPTFTHNLPLLEHILPTYLLFADFSIKINTNSGSAVNQRKYAISIWLYIKLNEPFNAT